MKSINKLFFFLFFFLLVLQISCQKELSCENCKENNKPPIAKAGTDQVIVLPKDSTLLDGSASTDPDGTITLYKWTKISGPASASINRPDSAKNLVKNLAMGVYQFELTVKDNGGLSAKDTIQIIVDDPAVNQPPVANAGTDQSITLPTDSTLLTGNLSFDPDGTIVSYQWTKISGPSLVNIVTAQTVQSKVKSLVQGAYQFEIKVTDNGGLSSKDTVQINVDAAITNNIPPVSKAGNDTTILSNQTSCTPVLVTATLNGSNSYDTDGNIVSYLWTGPGNITSPNSAITIVNGTFQGTVSFILKVTDNNGLAGYDTVYISVLPANRPLVPAQLTLIATLPQPRPASFAIAGNKIVFAGGSVGSQQGCVTTRVDIYDMVASVWSTAQLSVAREGAGVSVLGNKIFFAGGFAPIAGPPYGCLLTNWSNTRSSVVDIYDASANTWSTAQLSSARVPAGASAGNKVDFAGGDDSYSPPVADIYDAGNNSWSTSTLSQPRHIFQAAVAGNKIFFGGGSIDFYGVSGGNLSKKIDIYDASSNTWSVDNLSVERGEMGAIEANNKIYWAGGFEFDPAISDWNSTNSVEIKDLVTNITSFDCLSEAKVQITAVRKDNKIIFFGGYGAHWVRSSRFDIYDLATKSWSIGVLPQNLILSTIVSNNNTLYVTDYSKVWKLEF